MKPQRSRLPWFGVGLVLFGLFLLFRKFGYIDAGFGQIFWGLVMLWGIVAVGRGYGDGRRGKIFWGTVLFLFGLFFLLQTFESIEVRAYTFFPSLFLILGIAFLMVYLHDMHDWLLL